jgi:hypothetical protein
MKLIGFDIETTGDGDAYGLQPYRVSQGTARITSAAFVDEDGNTLAAKLEPSIQWLREQLEMAAIFPEDAYLIGWNTQFDVSWLIAVGLEKEVRACRWLDGEVFLRALRNDTDPNRRYGLKGAVAEYIPDFAGYKEATGVEQNDAGDFNIVNDALLQYNILDAKLTAQLGRIFIDALGGTQRMTLSALIAKSIVPVAKAWVEGIAIDTDAVDMWEQRAIKDRDERFDEVMSLSGLPDSDREAAKKMLASHVQLKKFLHAKGYPVAKTDKVELSKY